MHLTIVLRKEVADIAEAETLAEIVRNKLADHPDVSVKATIAEDIPNND